MMHPTRLLLALCCLLAASIGMPSASRAGTAIPLTDIWTTLNAKPFDGWYDVKLYAHSVSMVMCGGGITQRKDGTPRWPFAGTDAEQDGADVLDGGIPAWAPKGRYWAIVTCSYPPLDMNVVNRPGPLPSGTFRTAFTLPAGKTPIMPPPSLRLWTTPDPPSQNAPLTLYAQTDPGALCAAYWDVGATWEAGAAQRAGKGGILSWTWAYDDTLGTAVVTCDQHKLYAHAQTNY